MTTRLTANLVLGCALGAVAAGCTVHTYSAHPEYPSTMFVSHEPARYEASFHTDRSRGRATHRSSGSRPVQANVVERSTSHRDISRRDAKSVSGSKPQSHASAKPSRNERAPEKPSTGERNEEHVVLMPAKPEKTKAEPESAKKRSRVLSFRERLEHHVDKTNEEVAQKERERRKRMQSTIGAAVGRHN
jgi:hypothetical protein